eukprot:353946-Chlamydomonas_euryale.AAC.3
MDASSAAKAGAFDQTLRWMDGWVGKGGRGHVRSRQRCKSLSALVGGGGEKKRRNVSVQLRSATHSNACHVCILWELKPFMHFPVSRSPCTP